MEVLCIIWHECGLGSQRGVHLAPLSGHAGWRHSWCWLAGLDTLVSCSLLVHSCCCCLPLLPGVNEWEWDLALSACYLQI